MKNQKIMRKWRTKMENEEVQSITKISEENRYDVLKAAMELPYLPDTYYKIIMRYGVRTGSSIFFEGYKAKDIDIILSPWAKHIWSSLYDYGYGCYKRSSYRIDGIRSMYVKSEYFSVPVNLIFTRNSREFDSWKCATLWMKIIRREVKGLNHPLSKKENRVEMFRLLRRLADEYLHRGEEL
jgi:hypothetical protein